MRSLPDRSKLRPPIIFPFVLTTDVDHQFQRAGFDKKRLFYTQGDYGACHDKIYDNEDTVRQQDINIPTELIPRCPVCGAPMTMNLRCDEIFVQDDGWCAAASRYAEVLQQYKRGKILYLGIGVESNTPAIIKYPFWRMTVQNINSQYVGINLGECYCPKEIQQRSLCIDGDIHTILHELSQFDDLR